MTQNVSDWTFYPAPAKLNLDLRITGKRSDGYHNLESIFTLIGLYDEIGLQILPSPEIRLETPIVGVQPEQDLTVRAAKLLQKVSGSLKGVAIRIRKRIPMGGGLGGGSSDAATVLWVLNRLWGCGLGVGALIKLGVQLGADVPFFLFGQNAFARGIGEILMPFELPEQWYVIVRPNVSVSTPAVFSHERLTRDSKPSIMPTFQNLQPFRNDMQAVVLEEYPEVRAVFEEMQKLGLPRLTGSGSCLFISFDKQAVAEEIFRQLSNRFETYCVPGLKVHPLAEIFH